MFHECKEENGTKRYYNEKGQLHRTGGPAIEWPSGNKWWYRHEKLHRIDGPAIECADGYKEWYRHGELHREGGPAIENVNGYQSWYQHGKLHRIGGPAIEWPCEGTKEWYFEGTKVAPMFHECKVDEEGTKKYYNAIGKLHRTHGPAVERADGSTELWFNGEKLKRQLTTGKSVEKIEELVEKDAEKIREIKVVIQGRYQKEIEYEYSRIYPADRVKFIASCDNEKDAEIYVHEGDSKHSRSVNYNPQDQICEVALKIRNHVLDILSEKKPVVVAFLGNCRDFLIEKCTPQLPKQVKIAGDYDKPDISVVQWKFHEDNNTPHTVYYYPRILDADAIAENINKRIHEIQGNLKNGDVRFNVTIYASTPLKGQDIDKYMKTLYDQGKYTNLKVTFINRLIYNCDPAMMTVRIEKCAYENNNWSITNIPVWHRRPMFTTETPLEVAITDIINTPEVHIKLIGDEFITDYFRENVMRLDKNLTHRTINYISKDGKRSVAITTNATERPQLIVNCHSPDTTLATIHKTKIELDEFLLQATYTPLIYSYGDDNIQELYKYKHNGHITDTDDLVSIINKL